MYGSEFFSPWALVFRKARCLIRPRNLIRPRLQTSLTIFSLVRILLSTVSFLMRVSSLAEVIRTHRLDPFQDIDSTNLALYRVAFIADSVIINSLRNISEFEVEGAIRMEPQDTIFTHFPIQPQRIFGSEKGINVIVYPPAERMPEVLSKDN